MVKTATKNLTHQGKFKLKFQLSFLIKVFYLLKDISLAQKKLNCILFSIACHNLSIHSEIKWDGIRKCWNTRPFINQSAFWTEFSIDILGNLILFYIEKHV